MVSSSLAKLITNPMFSIIILNYNGKKVLLECLESVLKTSHPSFEVILVDNASSDGSVEAVLERYSSERLIKVIKNEKNLGYDEGNNVGARLATGKYLVFLNNDTVVMPNWLRNIESVLENDPNIGAAEPKILLHSNHRVICSAGSSMDIYGFNTSRGWLEVDKGQYDQMREIFFAGGTALIVKKKLFMEVGCFDPDFFLGAEDIDLSWRIRLKGYTVFYIPKAVIYHKVSATVRTQPSSNILFHIRKNRLSMLVRNYSLKNIARVLPVVLAIYVGIFLKELIFYRNPAGTSILAILHVMKSIRHQIVLRSAIQTSRIIMTDDEIIKSMCQQPLFITYIKQAFKRLA